MPRPGQSAFYDQTSSGVRFQWIMDGLESRGARDANAEVVHALLAWSDVDAFCRDIVGYTTFLDPTLPNLTRVLPHKCPTRKGMFADEFRLVDFGMLESRIDCVDADLNLAQDWAQYAVTFTRPHWACISDANLAAKYGNKEQFRYCRRQRRYVPRERRTSGFAYQYLPAGVDPAVDANWKDVPDESRFQADYQIEYAVTIQQFPVSAIPEDAIAEQLMTVNDAALDLGYGFTFPRGSLLFKGTQQDLEEYAGADGGVYEDLKLVWAFQPGPVDGDGWNSFLRPDLKAGQRDYGPIRRKNAGKDPLYPYGNHQLIFTPSA